MERALQLSDQYFSRSGAELQVGGCTIQELADQYGTPFYAYDRQVLAQTWTALRTATQH